eukprot:gene26317-31793_t
MVLVSLKTLSKAFGSIRKLPYQPISDQLTLSSVVVIHRHGDRSQISKTLGPNYPEHDKVTSLWRKAMPGEDMKRLMASVAFVAPAKGNTPLPTTSNRDQTDVQDKQCPKADRTASGDELDQLVYSGYDRQQYPYGQLTALGCSQMMKLGQTLKKRYSGLLDIKRHNAAEKMYLRSSNYCRTLQSLRCLLVGFLDEVLTAHHAHGIQHVQGVCDEHLGKIDEIVAFIWGVLYKDKIFNSLSIGRFIHELVNDLQTKTHAMCIYSAHDSTLTPLMCALDTFPPYASSLCLEICSHRSNPQSRCVRFLYNDEIIVYDADTANGAGSGEWHRLEDVCGQLQQFSLSREDYHVASVFGLEAVEKKIQD